MKLSENVCENIMASCLDVGSGRKYLTSIELDPYVGKWRVEGLDEKEKFIAKNYLYHPSTISHVYYHGTGKDSLDIKSLIPDSFYHAHHMNKDDCLVKVNRMTPGNFFYPHKDKLNAYVVYHENQKNKEDVTVKWITLTKPHFGHVFLIDDPNRPAYYMLDQGTVIEDFFNNIHVGINVGWEDRWFMSIQYKKMKNAIS